MKKVLVIRLSSIGDIVLTTPLIRCLKNQLEVTIHYLTKPSYKGLLENNPYLDRILLYGEVTVRELKSEKYDLIIDLHHNIRSWKISRALRVHRITYNKLNVEKWLLVNFKINRLPKIHIVDRYFKATESLGIKNDDQGLDYFLPPQTKKVSAILKVNSSFQVLVMGANYFTKRIPNSICSKIIEMYEGMTILLGGRDVLNEAKKLEDQHTKVLNLVGRLSIDESAHIINSSNIIYSEDTGLMHIAAALKKPVWVLWGNTVPEFGMGPYYGHSNKVESRSLEVNNLSCRPCSKLGKSECPKGHFKCMMEQEV